MLDSRRANRDIARMQHLHGFALDLVEADAIGRNKHLATRMGMPVVVNTLVKDNIMQPRRTCGVVVVQNIAHVNITVKVWAFERLFSAVEHHIAKLHRIAPRVFFRFELGKFLCRNMLDFAFVMRALPLGIVNHDLRKPAVRSRAVPMFDSGRNLHHIALAQNLRLLAFFLVVADATRRKDNHAAVLVPTATRPRLKRNAVCRLELVCRIRHNHRL